MINGLRQKVVVQPGGVIEIRSPELPVGSIADVIVMLDSPTEEANRSLVSFIGRGKGSFATPAEADEFIRRERNTWTY